jgi:hypothetical protein
MASIPGNRLPTVTKSVTGDVIPEKYKNPFFHNTKEHSQRLLAGS